jgi:CRISPR/Cas system-associated exonuclease Cas4 (RecB family)
MALGSAIHQGLARYHEELQLGGNLAVGQIHDTFVAAWEASEEERPIQYRKGESKAGLVEMGIRLLETYLQEPPPENILAIEASMMVPLWTSQGQPLEKPLVAVVDLLCDGNEALKLTEFKTSKRKYGSFEAESALQASCYALAVKDRYNRPVHVRYTVLVKTKTPSVQHLDTVRTEEDLHRLGDIVQAVDSAVQSEAFYPIENAMNCSGCPYRQPCREWQGGNRSQVQQLHSHRKELVTC